MARDLASGRHLEGKTRVEVLSLLGPADQNHDGTLVYKVDLGYRFASSPWLYDLVLRFGDSSKVPF